MKLLGGVALTITSRTHGGENFELRPRNAKVDSCKDEGGTSIWRAMIEG